MGTLLQGSMFMFMFMRKEAHLVRERDGFKADLDEGRALNRGVAADKETNETSLRILNQIKNP